jgi:hypothetical protein
VFLLPLPWSIHAPSFPRRNLPTICRQKPSTHKANYRDGAIDHFFILHITAHLSEMAARLLPGIINGTKDADNILDLIRGAIEKLMAGTVLLPICH